MTIFDNNKRLLLTGILPASVIVFGLTNCSQSNFSSSNKNSNKEAPQEKPVIENDGDSTPDTKDPEDHPVDDVSTENGKKEYQKPGALDSKGSTPTCKGANLTKNSDFELGNTLFTSRYGFQSGCSDPRRAPVPHPEFRYTVNTDPGACHAGYRSNVSGNSGKMLVINLPGAGQGENAFWCQSVSVVAGKTYELAVRMRTVATMHQSSRSKWTVDGSLFSSTFDPSPEWNTFTSKWQATSTKTIEVCGVNVVQNAESGDLAVDDVKFSICE